MKRKAKSSTAIKKKTKSSMSPDLDLSPTKPVIKPYDFDFSFAPAKKPPLDPTIPVGSPAGVTRISELRDLATSRVGELRKLLEHGNSEVIKEVEAFRTRISKRCKVQTQTCLQLTEDAEKDYKKISDRIKENAELITSSYAEHFAEIQTTASHVAKVVIPELAQSMERAIEGLRNHYKIPASPA